MLEHSSSCIAQKQLVARTSACTHDQEVIARPLGLPHDRVVGGHICADGALQLDAVTLCHLRHLVDNGARLLATGGGTTRAACSSVGDIERGNGTFEGAGKGNCELGGV